MSALDSRSSARRTANAMAPRLSPTEAPKLREGFKEAVSQHAQNVDSNAMERNTGELEGAGPNSAQRGLFGFGRKKEEKKGVQTIEGASPTSQPSTYPYAQANISPVRSTRSVQGTPASPNRSPYYSLPAGSQIFERDVQESIPIPSSPAIPSHIQTDDRIPPALDASSEAITDQTLDPDSVEIITHAVHQPAAVSVPSNDHVAGQASDDFAAASSYSTLDNSDVRRLSFISFADVVQSEHAGSRESTYFAGLSGLSSPSLNHTPSPAHSPASFGSPLTSNSASAKGLDMSPPPHRKSLGSPGSGELVETMSQAVRRTEAESGDAGLARSAPLSPISLDGLSDLS